MTLFHTVAFCGHLWQCFKKMANLVHKSNVCSFWLETLCQGQKNSEANFCFPRKKWLFFRPKGEKTIFSEGNKCSSQSFFDPGIMFSAWRIHFLGVSSSDLPQTSTFWWVLILHNLLADRPAPRGAAGGAGGGPPCKSKNTTFEIFFKKGNYYFT